MSLCLPADRAMWMQTWKQHYCIELGWNLEETRCSITWKSSLTLSINSLVLATVLKRSQLACIPKFSVCWNPIRTKYFDTKKYTCYEAPAAGLYGPAVALCNNNVGSANSAMVFSPSAWVNGSLKDVYFCIPTNSQQPDLILLAESYVFALLPVPVTDHGQEVVYSIRQSGSYSLDRWKKYQKAAIYHLAQTF